MGFQKSTSLPTLNPLNFCLKADRLVYKNPQKNRFLIKYRFGSL